MDRYEVLACVIILEHVSVYLCLANSTIILYSFLIQNTHFLALNYTEVMCSR